MKTENKITPEKLEQSIKNVKYTFLDDGVTTICQLTLNNEFTVIGSSACADPANFNRDLGMKYSLEKAKEKCWELLGFGLRTDLNLKENLPEPYGVMFDLENVTQFVGSYAVHASPMSRAKYVKMRGWELAEDEEDCEGYVFQRFVDGVALLSWMEKGFFESLYTEYTST